MCRVSAGLGKHNTKGTVMINILRPEQNGRHVSDDTFRCISWQKIFVYIVRNFTEVFSELHI